MWGSKEGLSILSGLGQAQAIGIIQNALSVIKAKLQQYTTLSDSLELLFLVGYTEIDLPLKKEEEEVILLMPPNAGSNPRFSGLQILNTWRANPKGKYTPSLP